MYTKHYFLISLKTVGRKINKNVSFKPSPILGYETDTLSIYAN